MAIDEATLREGPEVVGLCLGCRHFQSVPYRVQGDSGYDRRCLAAQRDFPDSYGDQRTPDWCPHPGALTAAEQRDEAAAAQRDELAAALRALRDAVTDGRNWIDAPLRGAVFQANGLLARTPARAAALLAPAGEE